MNKNPGKDKTFIVIIIIIMIIIQSGEMAAHPLPDVHAKGQRLQYSPGLVESCQYYLPRVKSVRSFLSTPANFAISNWLVISYLWNGKKSINEIQLTNDVQNGV